MTDDIARLGIEIDSSDVEKGEKALGRFGSEAARAEREVEQLAKQSKIAGKAMGAALGVAIFKIAKDTLSVNQSFESLRASLVTVTGDTEKAAIAFDGLQDFAAKTPFAVSELTQAFIKLGSLGLAPTERALISYGNTAGALGKSLNQISEAVADATVGEFERLKEFGIKAKSEGDKVSFTFAGVTTQIGKNAQEIQEYLIDLGETEFAGGMDRQAAILSGAFSNLGDSYDALLDTLLNEENSASLAEWVRSVGDGLDGLTDLIDGDTALESLGDKVEAAQNRLNALQSASGGFRASLTGVDDIDGEIKKQIQLTGDLEKQYRDLAIETFKSSGAFDELAKSLGSVGEAAPEVSKELEKALNKAQRDAQKTSDQFKELYSDLITPERENDVTSIDVNNLSLQADSALRAGDFDEAIKKAKLAFDLLEQMKEEGNAASFELEFYGDQLKKIGEEAAAGKIGDVQLEIDRSLAVQEVKTVNAAMQADLDANPLTQTVMIEWANPGDLSLPVNDSVAGSIGSAAESVSNSVSNSVQRSSDSSSQQTLRPITAIFPNGAEHTIYSDSHNAESFVREIETESRKRGRV